MSDIFENQGEVVENLEESAEAIGIDRERLNFKPKTVFVAKNGCKRCLGRGVLNIMPPGEKEKVRYPCRCVRIKVL